MRTVYHALAMLCLCFSACKKNNNSNFDTSATAPVSVEFDNIAGSADLQLGTGHYVNASGESFTLTKLRYYVSNFSFVSIDGTEYIVPQDSSYFLIDESDPSTHAPAVNIPEGEYKTFRFTLGVDSLRNTMDVSRRTGVLDPTAAGGDMYWGWNSGYIFFKMEGTSPAAGAMDSYMYHLGGFGGMSSPTINNLKRISLDLSARGEPTVKAGLQPNLHLLVDVLKLFDGTQKISIAATSMVMFEDYSTTISANTPAMFVHDHTEN